MFSHDFTRVRRIASRLAMVSFVAAILILPTAKQTSVAGTKSVTYTTTASPVVYHKTTNIDGLDIFYREAGPKNAPTVLLLHGFPTSSHMFRNLIPALAERYHVVAPDYPGYGNSSMPKVDEFEYTFDNLANVVEKFTEKVGLTKYSIYLMDYGAPGCSCRISSGREAS
jgi:dipeptidyl aminopeptidase/acylaminoacyl peptidase